MLSSLPGLSHGLSLCNVNVQLQIAHPGGITEPSHYKDIILFCRVYIETKQQLIQQSVNHPQKLMLHISLLLLANMWCMMQLHLWFENLSFLPQDYIYSVYGYAKKLLKLHGKGRGHYCYMCMLWILYTWQHIMIIVWIDNVCILDLWLVML